MSFKKSCIASALAIAALATGGAASAASVTVGTSNGANCYPFSCMAVDGTLHYQEIYSASAFGGAPLSIASVSFFRSIAGPMTSSTYSVDFWLSPRNSANMSTSAAANEGQLLSHFGSFSLGGDMPETLTLDGADFTYDPSQGSLLMDVQVTSGAVQGVYQSFFQADYSDFGAGPLFRGWGNGDSLRLAGGGLVTRFNTAAVPEAGTSAMLLAGLGLLGAAARRRRAA